MTSVYKLIISSLTLGKISNMAKSFICQPSQLNDFSLKTTCVFINSRENITTNQDLSFMKFRLKFITAVLFKTKMVKMMITEIP